MVALAIPAAVFLTGAVYQTLSVRRESIRFPPPGRAHSGSCEAQAQLRLSWIRRGYRFPLNRAGGTTQITYDRSTGKTHLRASDTGFWGFLNRLHHFHGLHNQTGVRNLWGWTVLFCVIGFIRAGRNRDLHVVQALRRTHDRPRPPGCQSGGFGGSADRAAEVTKVCSLAAHGPMTRSLSRTSSRRSNRDSSAHQSSKGLDKRDRIVQARSHLVVFNS